MDTRTDGPLDNQAASDRTWQAFIIEEAPYGHDGRNCVYYDPVTEVSCAIGRLLTPQTRQTLLDCRQPIAQILSFHCYPLIKAELEGCQSFFLPRLQSTHDQCGMARVIFREALVSLAGEWGLTVPSGQE